MSSDTRFITGNVAFADFEFVTGSGDGRVGGMQPICMEKIIINMVEVKGGSEQGKRAAQ